MDRITLVSSYLDLTFGILEFDEKKMNIIFEVVKINAEKEKLKEIFLQNKNFSKTQKLFWIYHFIFKIQSFWDFIKNHLSIGSGILLKDN